MGLGGLPSVGGAGQQPNQNNAGAKGGKEFSLEQQASNNQQAQAHAAQARSDLVKGSNASRLMKIVDKRKKNRKYAPRTMLIDGEIYEVYLLAIA